MLRSQSFKTRAGIIFTIFIFVISCNGQVKKVMPNNMGSEQHLVIDANSKLIKAQGSQTAENIRCMLQDKAGNLWFGSTGGGVYRYDNKSFTRFTVHDGLSSNLVWCMLEDRSGNIWFGTTEGICRYDAKAGQGKKFVPIAITGNFMPAVSSNNYYNDWSKKNTVWSMLQDKNGTIWIGAGDGMYCFNGTVFTRFLDNKDLINTAGFHLKMVDCIIEDKNGIIWFASGMLPGMEGICRYNGKTLSGFKPGGDGWIRCLLEDKTGIIWSGGRHKGIWQYDTRLPAGQALFNKFTAKEGIGCPLLADKNGNIWFGGEENNKLEIVGGIWCYDGNSFKNFTIEDGIGKYAVWSITEDSYGNIWFGTRNTGLYKYDGKKFAIFSE
ncbi:MAG: two-component regulator propeller domain-containing protein [Ferruginibacter sp.]